MKVAGEPTTVTRFPACGAGRLIRPAGATVAFNDLRGGSRRMTGHRADYVGRHRKDDPPTIPQKILTRIHDHVVTPLRVSDPGFLFTHHNQLHREENQK